jgi:hypothetical protein
LSASVIGVSDQFSVTERWALTGKSSVRIGNVPPPWLANGRVGAYVGLTPAPFVSAIESFPAVATA